MDKTKTMITIDILYELITEIKDNRDFLSEIDAAVGDGDHGVNMYKGFNYALGKINPNMSLSEGFDILSEVLLDDIGGSMGPIYGSLFMGYAEAIRDKKYFTDVIFQEMMESGFEMVEILTEASVGDKTIMDVLTPVSEVRAADYDSFSEYLVAVSDAAIKGLESTKNLVAKFGRGVRQGDRSLGHYDAGATSCNIIIQSLVSSVLERKEYE